MASQAAHDHKDASAKPRAQAKSADQAVGVEAGFAEAEPSALDSRALTPARIEVLQRLVGNQAVQRMISDVQRAPPTSTPAPAGGVTAPPPDAPKENPDLEKILKTDYLASGDNFDLKYSPNSGNPPTVRPIFGNVLVTLRIHIDYKDFGPEMQRQAPYNTYHFSRAQRAQMRWTDEERATFNRNTIKSIQDGWSEKHSFACIEPGLEELVANMVVNVELTDDITKAHNKMTAQKVPDGAPRFRSFVNQGDHTSVLDSRDPTEVETHSHSRQIGQFDVDSDDPAALSGAMDAAVAEIKKFPPPTAANTAEPQALGFVGHTDKTGAKTHNEALAKRRAANVHSYIVSQSGWSGLVREDKAILQNSGANNPANRRVDIWMLNITTQNTTAHEAGHMFGLDDEYPDAEAGHATGDHPDHYDPVKNEQGLGQAEADKLVVGDSNNIMSEGSQVQPGHYVYFLQKLESLTSKKWAVRN